MIVLGIETSCDETAVAIVDAQGHVHAHHLKSQTELHQPHGGVVPEMAARDHLRCLRPLITQSLTEANLDWSAIDAIAAAAGPGLIGGVMVGVMMAKALAAAANKPFIAVNHLEAHALTVRLTEQVEFPYLLLLVSGGHSQFLLVRNVGQYELLGTTIDDALGEAFDKVARLLDLDYPGGPALEKLARQGDPNRFHFPRPLINKPGCDFSFSGLKTAVRLQVDQLKPLTTPDKADIAASFQTAVGDCLINRTQHAFEQTPDIKNVVIAGGVAANQYLRQRLQELCVRYHKDFIAPPLALCTDNGAMIAWAGLERFRQGLTDSLDFVPRPRWPLMEVRYT